MQVFLHTDSILEELGVTSGSNINSIYEAQEVGVDEIMRNHSVKELIQHYNRNNELFHKSTGHQNFTKPDTKQGLSLVPAHVLPISSLINSREFLKLVKRHRTVQC